MNFFFELSTRYRVDIEKIKFISISGHVIFCLLYKHTYDDVIDYFPKIFDHFPEISEDFPNLSEGQANVSEQSLNIFRRLPKISEDCRTGIAEDCRGRTDNVSIIQQDIWVLSQR